MALARKAYRISKFGTVVLPQEIRRATFCLMRLQIQAVRGVTYYSKERIPGQAVHGWVTARNADGFVVKNDWDWRFDKQQWLLWELTDYQVTVNQCFIANKQTEVLLTELAKKPNTPPLPPSLPPVNYDAFFGRVPSIIHGFESITVKTRVNADFDVEFIYDTRETNNCSPVPTEIPRGPAPLENELPKPGGDNGIAPGPVFPPASLPANSTPVGGTSKIPEGYEEGDQSGPPNASPFPPGATSTRFRLAYQTAGAQSQGCVLPALTVIESQFYAGLFVNGDLQLSVGNSDGQGGFPCDAVRFERVYSKTGLGVVFSVLYNGVSAPVLLEPLYQ